MLQCVAACRRTCPQPPATASCNSLQESAVCLVNDYMCCSVLHRTAVCCCVLQCVAVVCSVLQVTAVYCSVLECVAVCFGPNTLSSARKGLFFRFERSDLGVS